MNKLDFVKSAERWQRYGEEYHNKAGDYLIELNRALLTVNIFLLGFVGIFLQLDNSCIDVNFKRIVLSIAFISLMVSITLGLIIFIKINRLLNRAGDYYEELCDRLFTYVLRENVNSGDQYPKEIYKNLKLENKFDNKTLIFELIFLGLGFSSIIFYLFKVIR